MTHRRIDERRPALGLVTRRVAANAAVRAAAEMLGKIATLAWTVLAARELAPDAFGAFSYALALMLLVSSLPAWGFDPVMVRRASLEPELLPRLQTEALAWQTIIAVPTYLVTLLVVAPGRPSAEATVALVLVLIAGFPETWSDTARASASARQSQAGVAIALVVQRVATAVFIIAILVAGGGLVGVAFGFLAGTAVGWAGHLMALRRLGLRVRLTQLTWAGLRDMLLRTRLIGVSAIVLVMLFRVDTVILEALRGDEEVAHYAVAYRLLETVLFVAYSVRQATTPVMNASIDGTRIIRGYESATAATAAVYMPLAAVCLVESESVIRLLFGEQYVAFSAEILRWLAPAPLLFAAAFLAFTGLYSRGRTVAMLMGSLVATVVNVTVNFLLIPPYGGVGAAIATTVSYVALSAWVIVALRASVGRIRLWRPLLESAAASCVLALVLLALQLPLLVELVVGGAVYVAVWLLLVRRFSPQQIQVLRSLVPGGSA